MPFHPSVSSDASGGSDDFGIQSLQDGAELQFGSWGDCSAACGDGWQTRVASCVGPTGAMLALAQCRGADRAVTSRPCRCIDALPLLLGLGPERWALQRSTSRLWSSVTSDAYLLLAAHSCLRAPPTLLYPQRRGLRGPPLAVHALDRLQRQLWRRYRHPHRVLHRAARLPLRPCPAAAHGAGVQHLALRAPRLDRSRLGTLQRDVRRWALLPLRDRLTKGQWGACWGRPRCVKMGADVPGPDHAQA